MKKTIVLIMCLLLSTSTGFAQVKRAGISSKSVNVSKQNKTKSSLSTPARNNGHIRKQAKLSQKAVKTRSAEKGNAVPAKENIQKLSSSGDIELQKNSGDIKNLKKQKTKVLSKKNAPVKREGRNNSSDIKKTDSPKKNTSLRKVPASAVTNNSSVSSKSNLVKRTPPNRSSGLNRAGKNGRWVKTGGTRLRKYIPSRYYPYSYFYRPFFFGNAISVFFSPSRYRGIHFSYNYGYPYDYYYYYPRYTRTVVYNVYDNSDKLSADYTMIESDQDEEYVEYEYYDEGSDTLYEKEYFDISGVKVRNTRIVRQNGNFIGFEIYNGSAYSMESVSLTITIRGMEEVDYRSGIMYKFETPLEPGKKVFCKISADDLKLKIPDTYTVFSEIESITMPSGEIAISR